MKIWGFAEVLKKVAIFAELLSVLDFRGFRCFDENLKNEETINDMEK
jgi:hypothetical protein